MQRFLRGGPYRRGLRRRTNLLNRVFDRSPRLKRACSMTLSFLLCGLRDTRPRLSMSNGSLLRRRLHLLLLSRRQHELGLRKRLALLRVGPHEDAIVRGADRLIDLVGGDARA